MASNELNFNMRIFLMTFMSRTRTSVKEHLAFLEEKFAALERGGT